MTMTRKDFISIASAINESTIKHRSIGKPVIEKETLIKSMCIILKANNERFDASRFIDACNDSIG